MSTLATHLPPMTLRVDDLEQTLMRLPKADLEIVHRFTPGLYSREMRVKAGSMVTSKIHKTRHPFVVSQGHLTVWNPATGECVEIRAPYHGVTEPGTRRVALIHADTIWTTFHPTDLTDPEAIEAEIIEKRDEHLAGLVQPEGAPCLSQR